MKLILKIHPIFEFFHGHPREFLDPREKLRYILSLVQIPYPFYFYLQSKVRRNHEYIHRFLQFRRVHRMAIAKLNLVLGTRADTWGNNHAEGLDLFRLVRIHTLPTKEGILQKVMHKKQVTPL